MSGNIGPYRPQVLRIAVATKVRSPDRGERWAAEIVQAALPHLEEMARGRHGVLDGRGAIAASKDFAATVDGLAEVLAVACVILDDPATEIAFIQRFRRSLEASIDKHRQTAEKGLHVVSTEKS